jgi:hypothetical protein
MSGLPPNYNPDASMLQGGTTSVIQPVMGGGGAPSNYNIESSLLAGGTGDIVKILGGGAKTEGNLQGEVYEVVDNDITQKYRADYFNILLQDYDAKKVLLQVLLNDFIKERTDTIQRYDVSGAPQNPTLPTIAAIQAAGEGPLPLFSTVYDVIPPDIDSVVMIPPINGNKEKFVQILQYLFKTEIFRKETANDLRLRSGVSIVCMAPFYSTTISDSQENVLLFYLHLRLWNSNRSSFYVLNSHTSFKAGIDLYTQYEITTPQFPIVNTLNPSYLLLNKPFGKYKGIVISAEPGQILKSPRKNKNKEFPSPSQSFKQHSTFATQSSNLDEDIDSYFNDFLLIGSQGYKSELLNSRTDISICTNLLTVFYDEDINEKIYMISDKRDEIHVFRFNTIQEPPLLCINESGEAPTFAPPPGLFAGKERDTRFVKAPTKRIIIDAITRKIRRVNDEVYKNWREGIFSKDEADFLNHLQLTPTVLHFIFDVNWKVETANFLKKIVLSDCFTDVRLLTHAECDSTRQYLDKILDYFYAHAAYKADDSPIHRLVLPKIILEEEEAAILEPSAPQIVPRPQAAPLATILWEPAILDIDGKKFDKKSFGQIEKKADGDFYIIDFIAIQKESGLYLFKRYTFDIKLINDEVEKRNKQEGQVRKISVVDILREKMEQLQEQYPNFTILY